MDTFKERLSELMKNRLFVLLVIVAAIFAVLVCRLFYMQIVNGEEASAGITSSVTREVSMPAARGNIYDLSLIHIFSATKKPLKPSDFKDLTVCGGWDLNPHERTFTRT